MAVIRQRTQVFNQPVGVVRADAGAQGVGASISRAAGTMASLAFQEASDEAQKRGIDLAQAVEEKRLRTINPETGAPEAYTPPSAFGKIAADSYQRVIDKRFEDSMSEELRLKAQEISLKYQYDAETYDQVMSDYIGGMAENATGKYKQYIEGTGAKYLALTKLNIQERAAARARANAAQSIITGIDKATDNAYNIALQGGFMPREGEEASEAGAVLSREIANASNGVNSGLLKGGADSKAQAQISQAIARGGVEYILGKTDSSMQRNAVELAIRTRGKETGTLPSDLKDEVTALLKHVDAANIETVLRHSSTVASDYNAVERDIIEQQKIAAEQEARRSAIQYSDSLTDFSAQSTNLAASGFSADTPFAVGTAIGQANMMFGRLQGNVQSRFMAGQLTEAQMESDLKEGRQELLRPFLIQAAAEGNVEELRIAINTRNPADMQKLNPKQINFIDSLYKSEFFDPTEDIGYAREVLSASQNTARELRDRELFKREISQLVTEAGELASSGGLSDEAYDKLVNHIESNIGPDRLLAEQAESEINRLSKQRAFGVASVFAAGASSRDLNNLATYVDSDGQRTEGMSPDVIAAGNLILEQTNLDQRDKVVGKINGLKTKIATEEAEMQNAVDLRVNQVRILGGNGNVNDSKDRKYSQQIFDSNGIDLKEFYNLDPTVQQTAMRIMRSAAPQNLIDNLERMGSGLPVENAETFLNLYATLSNDPVQESPGVFINRFGKSLDDKTVELLNDANSIRITIGGNANEILTTLVERQNDPKSRINMNIVLKDKTPTQYATEYAKGDQIIGAELSPAVEYLLLTGKGKKQVDARLETLIDQKYPRSKHIADPRFPVGSIKRSRYALEAQFPEKDERIAFVASVESQLPSGYALIPNIRAGDKKVYLVPDDSTAGVNYFAHYVDENNELRPLIFDKDGESMFPVFNRNDISDYYAEQARKNAEELELLEQQQGAIFERTRKLKQRPGLRTLDPFGG